MVEVDSEVSVIALHRLRDVLDDCDVERDRNSENRQNNRLVFFVCNERGMLTLKTLPDK